MARVAIPLNAMANVMELVEVAPYISTMGLVDFMVDIRVGIAWWLSRVGNIVTS